MSTVFYRGADTVIMPSPFYQAKTRSCALSVTYIDGPSESGYHKVSVTARKNFKSVTEEKSIHDRWLNFAPGDHRGRASRIVCSFMSDPSIDPWVGSILKRVVSHHPELQKDSLAIWLLSLDASSRIDLSETAESPRVPDFLSREGWVIESLETDDGTFLFVNNPKKQAGYVLLQTEEETNWVLDCTGVAGKGVGEFTFTSQENFVDGSQLLNVVGGGVASREFRKQFDSVWPTSDDWLTI